MSGEQKMPWLVMHELQPADLVSTVLPNNERIAAEAAASGGITLTTKVEPCTAAVLGGHEFRVAGDEVLCTPRTGAGGMRPLSTDVVRSFLDGHVAGWLRVDTDAEVDQVVERVRTTVLNDHAEAAARVPADVQRGSELDAEQRRTDRLAEIERVRAALADEEADLTSGTPVADEQVATERRGWRRRGAP